MVVAIDEVPQCLAFKQYCEIRNGGRYERTSGPRSSIYDARSGGLQDTVWALGEACLKCSCSAGVALTGIQLPDEPMEMSVPHTLCQPNTF